jgi:hypothetical protein
VTAQLAPKTSLTAPTVASSQQSSWRDGMPERLQPPRQAGGSTTPRWRRFNIRQLTDVSICKLQQYF